jgi:tetratricopeptide (TPR) repeat protein
MTMPRSPCPPRPAGTGPAATRRARLLATALVAATLGALPGGPARAQAPSPGVVALLDQANYWKLQNRPDQVLRTLERVLQVDPRNADALSGIAEAHAQLGNAAQAQEALGRLRAAAPSDPRTAAADVAVRTSTVDAAALAQARALAQAGRSAEAAERYRALFRGAPVPDSFALEYYTNLAGSEGGWAEARNGLGALARRAPGNTAVQLAYAQVLTYREDTRAEGIEMLRRLSGQPASQQSASAAWRQALTWIGSGPEAVPALEGFLRQYPNDADIQRRLEEARNPPGGAADPGTQERLQAWDLLQRNQVRQAEERFQAALALNPNDAEANGGLGLIRLRQNRQAEGRRLLQQAILDDPTRAAEWQRALDSIGRGGGGGGGFAGRGGGGGGAVLTPDLQRARNFVDAGDLSQAEPLLNRIVARNGGDRPDAEALLGDIALRQGNAALAETQFRAALARRSNFGAAQSGLANALQAQGKFAEAEEIFRRLGTTTQPAVRADALRAEAARTEDPAAAAALLRAAMQNEPNNPWIRADFARLLARSGQGAEARRLMDETVAGRATPETLFAAAIFANEQSRPADSVRLLERIPANVRNADMNRMLTSVRIQSEVRAAASLATIGQRDQARQRLMAIAARRDPTGEAAPAAVRALNQMNEPVAAQAAARAAAIAARGQSPTVQLAAASSLLEAGLDREAAQATQLIGTERLDEQQRRQAAGLQAGLTIRASDQLNARGDQATAFEVLAPTLRQDPQNPATNLALGRLYQGARDNEQAGRIAEAVLSRNPRDTDARQAAMDAAIAGRDWGRAEALLAEGRALMPNDPRIPLLEARLARAWGDQRRAQVALQQAAQMRRQQIGLDTQPGMLGGATALGTPQGAQQAPAAAGFDNPFRRVPLSGQGQPPVFPTQAGQPMTTGRGLTQPPQLMQGQQFTQSMQGVPSAPPPDPLLNEINRQLVEVNQEAAPRLTAAMGFRTRSGTSGLDRLTELHGGADGSVAMPGIGGRIGARVAGVTLDTGSIAQNIATARQFGSAPAVLPGNNGTASAAQIAAATNTETQVSGVALGVAYMRDSLTIDVGSTPIGFPIENYVGGVEIAPMIGDGVRLRLIGERRAVTDSLLSWAGRRDPTSGTIWGGVTRTGGRAQLEFNAGDMNFYIAGGYYTFDGDGVAENSRIEAGAGFQFPLWSSTTQEIISGLDIVYFAYDTNLRYQTLGHGGYYSPQSFIAASIPVDWRGRSGNFYWRLGGSLGVSAFTEDAVAIFPNNAALQQGLVTRAATESGVATTYAGQSKTGVNAGLRGDLEYMVTPQLRIGGTIRFDQAADWNEARGLLYARYRFQ